MKRLVGILASAVLLSGCGVQAGSMADIQSSQNTPISSLKVLNNDEEASASSSFSVQSQSVPTSDNEQKESAVNMKENLLQKSAYLLDQYRKQDSGNTMLSPVSLYAAPGLAANGADGQTLSQMEQFLGISTEEANLLFKQIQDDGVVKSANSIWHRNGDNALKAGSLTLQTEFKDIAENAYRGEIIACDFTDPATVGQMNQWVNDHTDGMIPEIVSELSPNTAMTILNALLFEGLWINPYSESAVQKEDFTLFDGSSVQAEMMSSTEHVYLENQYATGFIKGYQEGYSFAAVLPKKTGTFTLEELSLDTLLHSEFEQYEVHAKLPKFTFSSGGSLSELMKNAGVTDAFQEGKADFSKLFYEDTPVWISDVVQKTKIELSESGTKAAAVTSVMFLARAALTPPSMQKEVILDRPFVFLILKDGLDIPLFIGVVENPNAE